MKYLLLTLVLGLGSLRAAPAPVYRPLPPLVLEGGSWTMTWGTSTSTVWFRVDGTYTDYYRDEYWTGTWTLEGNVLSVREVSPNGNDIRWSAILDLDSRKGGKEVNGGRSTSLVNGKLWSRSPFQLRR